MRAPRLTLLPALAVAWCRLAGAQPVLLQAEADEALNIGSVRTYAGVLDARTARVEPSREIIAVVLAGSAGPDALKAALLSLYDVAKPENALRLALVSSAGVQVAGPFRNRRQFAAAVAEAVAAGASAQSPPPALLAEAFAQWSGAWRTVAIIGHPPAIPTETAAYAAAWLSRRCRHQKLRIAFWSPEGEPSEVVLGTGGAAPAELSGVAEFVNRKPQAFVEVGWPPPALDAGFHPVKNAALRLLDELRESDSAAVYGFSNGVTLLQEFTTDKRAAKQAVLRTRPAGRTAKHIYMLAYRPPETGPRWRKIEIAVEGLKDCRIRAKEGYLAEW